MDKVKLPKPASSATDAQLDAYISTNGLLPGGDKRVLTEEIQRLRKLCRKHGVDESEIMLPAPVKPSKNGDESNELL